MLEIRSHCENCSKSLPVDSTDAMICSFECTFCWDCVTTLLENVCPNCGGGFEKRPVRPSPLRIKYPEQIEPKVNPIDWVVFEPLKNKNKTISPENR